MGIRGYVDSRGLSLAAVSLGAVAIVASLGLGWIACGRTLSNAQKHFEQECLSQARLFAHIIDQRGLSSDEEALSATVAAWSSMLNRPNDAFMRVIDRRLRVIQSSRDDGPAVVRGSISARRDDMDTSIHLADVVDGKRTVVGDFILPGEGVEIAAYVPVANRAWAVGVHRSREAVVAEIQADILLFRGALMFVCGVLIPLSLGTLCYVFVRSERRRNVVEDTLDESYQWFRAAFEQTISGVMLCKLIVDANGEPVDFTINEANEAILRNLDLEGDIVGRGATNVFCP